MCMAAPGPRCASHLQQSLSRAKTAVQVAERMGEPGPLGQAKETLNGLRFEFAGTRRGQAELDKRIARSDDEETRADLEAYKARARQAYVDKVELLRAVEAEVAKQAASSKPSSATSASSYTGKGTKSGYQRWGVPGSDVRDSRAPGDQEVQHDDECNDEIANTGACKHGHAFSGSCGRSGCSLSGDHDHKESETPRAVSPSTSAAAYSWKNPKGWTYNQPTAEEIAASEARAAANGDAWVDDGGYGADADVPDPVPDPVRTASRTSATAYTHKRGK